MIISEYAAKRTELEKKMLEITDRQTAHKLELSAKHQIALQKIASQIGQLKHQRAEENKRYEQEKSYFHRKYREEKLKVTEAMHLLRLEYLTVNGVVEKKGGES